nr:macrophage mannose receptor 1 [Helicoverpa armigera]
METALAISFISKCLVLISFTFIDSTGSEKFGCDYKYSSIAGGWFKYQQIPATWYDARLRCSLEGAILASPSTRYKLVVMSKLIDNILDEADDFELEVFIGISATFAKGDFSSIEGIPLSEITHRWAESEPDNKNNNEQCLTMNSDTLLSDVNCNKTLPYFCFKPQNLTGKIDGCGPKPEYDYDKRTNSCYKFHTEARTFSNAYLACSAEGGYLTIINNDEEAQVIRELFSNYPATSMIGNFDKYVAFVGVNKWGDDGEWRTIHGETLEAAGYATFAEGEPNNNPIGGDNCGSVYRNAELNDVNCEEPHAFICEKNPKYPAVCDDEINDQT